MFRLIGGWPNAGLKEDGLLVETGKGSPQREIVTPVLASLSLHYALDLRMQRKWRNWAAFGEESNIRYADGFVVATQYHGDAGQFLGDVQARIEQFGPNAHPDRTRLIEFGRFSAANREQQG